MLLVLVKAKVPRRVGLNLGLSTFLTRSGEHFVAQVLAYRDLLIILTVLLRLDEGIKAFGGRLLY